MAKQSKDLSYLLRGKWITVVAKKKGNDDRVKDLIYEEAILVKQEFERKGWSVQLYQQGFYQPFNKNRFI